MNEQEAHDFVDVMEDVIKQTITVTCIVYLRSKCKECIFNRLEDKITYEFMEKHEHLVEEDVPQFFRQLVIFTKEFTEECCKEECTADKFLRGIFGEQVESKIF